MGRSYQLIICFQVNDRLCIFANVLPFATDLLTAFTEMSSRVESPVMLIPNASPAQYHMRWRRASDEALEITRTTIGGYLKRLRYTVDDPVEFLETFYFQCLSKQRLQRFSGFYGFDLLGEGRYDVSSVMLTVCLGRAPL